MNSVLVNIVYFSLLLSSSVQSQGTVQPPDPILPGFLSIAGKEYPGDNIGTFNSVNECAEDARFGGYWNKRDGSCIWIPFNLSITKIPVIRYVNNVPNENQIAEFGFTKKQIEFELAASVDATPQSKIDFFSKCDLAFRIDDVYTCQKLDSNPDSQFFLKLVPPPPPPDPILPGFLTIEGKELLPGINCGKAKSLEECANGITIGGFWNKFEEICYSIGQEYIVPVQEVIRYVNDVPAFQLRKDLGINKRHMELRRRPVTEVDATPQSKINFFKDCAIAFRVNDSYSCQLLDSNPNSQFFFKLT